MSYTQLLMPDDRWPHVSAFVRKAIEDLFFRDVHDMLRLPIQSVGIVAGCNFAIAHVLLASVGGISTTLYAAGTGDGHYQRSFCNCLVDLYPWDSEEKSPREKVDKRAIAKTLWEEFRGPIAHRAGLWTDAHGGGAQKVRDRGYKIKFKRLTSNTGDGLPPGTIALIEASANWPLREMRQTLVVRSDAKVLSLERFYWGIRQMIAKVVEDQQRMKAAEKFLRDIN